MIYGVIGLLCVANVFNLGADITAMGAAARLLFGGHLQLYGAGFGLLSLALQTFVPYRRYGLDFLYLRVVGWTATVVMCLAATGFVLVSLHG